MDALLKNGAIIDTKAKAEAKDSSPKIKEKLATEILSSVSWFCLLQNTFWWILLVPLYLIFTYHNKCKHVSHTGKKCWWDNICSGILQGVYNRQQRNSRQD